MRAAVRARRALLLACLLAVPALAAGLSVLAGPASGQAGEPGAAQPPPSGTGPVLRIHIEGAITRATDLYLEEAMELAAREDASAILVVLNTPGGELEATFAITDRILASPIPVIGYVAPRAANAWSAGTVILLSTHVAAMAPFSIIGSSQPVAIGEGGFTPINDSKIINALVAKLRAFAATHGRNETAAEAFVTENLNLEAEQALEADVIEVVAPTAEALLAEVDGRVVGTPQGNATLATAGKPIVDVQPSVRVVLLDVFFNPVIAGLLMLVGIYALIFGLGNPGMGAEIAGAVAILLALVGLGFNVSLVALALIGLGAALLLVELHTPGFGVFGTAGLVAIVLGTIFILPLAPTGPEEGFSFPAAYQQQVLLILALPSIVFAGFLVFALLKVQEARRRPKFLKDTLVGEEVETLDVLAADKPGFVRYRGEHWQARAAPEVQGDIPAGSRVRIAGKDEATLLVAPAATGEAPATTEAEASPDADASAHDRSPPDPVRD